MFAIPLAYVLSAGSFLSCQDSFISTDASAFISVAAEPVPVGRQ